MAIQNDGPNSGFYGKVGSIIGYRLNGQWVIKGLPKVSRKNRKGTAKQQACRTRFTKMQQFLSPLVAFLRVGFNMEGRKKMMTAHNAAKSYNMQYAQNAEGEIDYSKISLTFGSILGAENPTVELLDKRILFTWTDNTGTDHFLGNDQVMLVAYDVEHQNAFFSTSGARRRTGHDVLEFIEGKRGATYHTWIAFISDDRERISMSTYVGSFVH